MPPFIDIMGQRFNRLVAIQYLGNGRWLFRCNCESDHIARGVTVRCGRIKSCGCLNQELKYTRKTRLRHGMTGSPTWISWQSMIQRTSASSSGTSMGRYYADSGVEVCERWLIFENFLEDMGVRPEGMTLDRTKNEIGYQPGNCRWATPKEQANNRRDPMCNFCGQPYHGPQGPCL